jgi:hypothetical protein
MSKSKRRFGEEEDQQSKLFRGHRTRGFSKVESLIQEAQAQPPTLLKSENFKKAA